MTMNKDIKHLTYIALSLRSEILGSVRVTIIPLFILAGSRAQFDIPINATLFSLEMRYRIIIIISLLIITKLLDHHCQILLSHPPAKDAMLSMVNKVMPQLNQLHPVRLLIQMLLCLSSLGNSLH